MDKDAGLSNVRTSATFGRLGLSNVKVDDLFTRTYTGIAHLTQHFTGNQKDRMDEYPRRIPIGLLPGWPGAPSTV